MSLARTRISPPAILEGRGQRGTQTDFPGGRALQERPVELARCSWWNHSRALTGAAGSRLKKARWRCGSSRCEGGDDGSAVGAAPQPGGAGMFGDREPAVPTRPHED